ncbi:hypothetical protein NX059_011012 [Plenodomus lindquistii]|nr:hypothetical protein NX059_011012 [Plenodomus lindquistii]
MASLSWEAWLESLDNHNRTPAEIGFMKLIRQEGGIGKDEKIRGTMVTCSVSTNDKPIHCVSKQVTLELGDDCDLFYHQPGPYFQDPRLTQGTTFARSWYAGCKVDNLVRTVGRAPDYPAIQAWMEHCSSHHEGCQMTVSEKLNVIRVIDVVQRVLVSYHDCDHARYAALSYVWGNAPQPRMGESAILPKVLPRTIEHALLVVKNMGLRYLWVDSLCIKQDSPDDKAAQIGIMGDIYSGAFVTLIALDGVDANSGLAGVSNDTPRTPQAFLEIGSLTIMARCPRFDHALLNSPWMRRGWTYQEGVLSRRCLFFSASQAYYRCNSMYCSEDLHDARDFGFSQEETDEDVLPHLRNVFDELLDPFTDTHKDFRNREGGMAIYKRLLDQYLYRKVSFEADVVLAFSALLQRLTSTAFPDGFIWGLPRSDFRNSLLWAGGHKRRTTLNQDLPSWSWAGWQFWREEFPIRARPAISIGLGTSGNSRPPLRIWHDGEELEGDVQDAVMATTRGKDVDADTLQGLWAGVEMPDTTASLTTPPTTSALSVEGLVLTVSSTYFATGVTSSKGSGLVLCFADDFSCRCQTYSSGTEPSLRKSGYDRQFLVVNTWVDDDKLALRLLLLGGEDKVMAREGYVELNLKAQPDMSERVALEGLKAKAKLRMERFWLV